jgi:predicted AlkP superfamily phosphohydrolase/phosphomutase
VVRTFGADPIGSSDRPGRRTAAQLAALADSLIEKTRQKTACSLSLLAQGVWDLFCVTYTDVHCAGHQLWHVHDPSTADDQRLADQVGDLLFEVYRETDAAVGELLSAVSAETTVVLFTGPGMGPNHTGSHLLDDVLRRLEPGAVGPRRRVMDPVRSTYRRVVPTGIRSRLRDRADGIDEASLVPSRRRRRFFAVPSNENAGAVRVNLVGREPNGVVCPGAELDRMVEQLRDELLALTNITSGAPVVQEVIRTDSVYHGDHLGWLPDVLVVWTQSEPVVGVRSSAVGDVWREYPGQRTGDHTSDFLFAARGPGLTPGLLVDLDPIDFAPAISHLLEVVPPEGIDGAASPELVRSAP